MANNGNTCAHPNNDLVNPPVEEPVADFSVLAEDSSNEETQGTELEEATEAVAPGVPFPPIVNRNEQWGRGHGWSAPVQGQSQEMPLIELMFYPLRSNQAARPRQEAPAPMPFNEALAASLNEVLRFVGDINGDFK